MGRTLPTIVQTLHQEEDLWKDFRRALRKMETRTFRSYEPDQIIILPPSLRGWLPRGHLAYFSLDVVSSLDLSGILNPCGGPARGTVKKY